MAIPQLKVVVECFGVICNNRHFCSGEQAVEQLTTVSTADIVIGHLHVAMTNIGFTRNSAILNSEF